MPWLPQLLLALWAAAESSFWFVAPDFLLIPLALHHPRQWFRLSVIAWIASFAGGTLYFLWAAAHVQAAGTILAGTPFVTDRMLDTISRLYEQHGVWGALAQSWSFMSFKIWTYETVHHGFSYVPYFAVVMFSRIFRIFVVTWIAARCSKSLPLWQRRPLLSWLLYTTGFLAMLMWMEK